MEYQVQRTSDYTGSSYEDTQKRSIADQIFMYGRHKQMPMLWGLGGWLLDKKGQWVKYKGALRTQTKKAKKIEWYDEDLVSFEMNGKASAVAVATTGTSYDFLAAADFNKVRLGDVVRCIDTAARFMVTALGTSPAVTLKSMTGAASTIPANANLTIVGRAVKEGSSAGSERDSYASNNYNYMQEVREDASITRTAEDIALENNGPGWDEKGRRKAKSLHVFMRYLENTLVYGKRGEFTDADSKTVWTSSGISDYTIYNVFAANAEDSSSEFSGIGHGGDLSLDEFFEYARILSTHYDKGEVVPVMAGTMLQKCFTYWAQHYSGTNYMMSAEKDTFGFDVTKIKTPYLTFQLLPSGVIEENEPGSFYFLDPTLLSVKFLNPIEYVEVDLRKTANRTDATAWTWLAKLSLEMRGAKRFGKIAGVTGVEI